MVYLYDLFIAQSSKIHVLKLLNVRPLGIIINDSTTSTDLDVFSPPTGEEKELAGQTAERLFQPVNQTPKNVFVGVLSLPLIPIFLACRVSL